METNTNTAAVLDRATELMLNRPPAITWHRLKMNDVQVELPPVKAPSTDAITVTVPAQVRFYQTMVGADANEHAGDSDLDGAFERALEHIDTAHTWETGMGEQAAEWLSVAAARHIAVEVPEGASPSDAVVVNIAAQDAACAIAAIDVIARPHSNVHIAVQTDSPQSGAGVAGSIVRIVAGRGARVRLTQLQTLDSTWKHLDNVGVFAADDAQVDIEQTVLGGLESYTGLAVGLSGFRSACNVDTRYLGHASNKIDFNYIIRQRGRKTRSTLVANGVLADASSKLLRGTIDLIHGAKGSVGREQETVMLANEQARNKTIPVILCDEDDVQGDHGATIGHVNPEQLEYMQSRGLSTAQIEALFETAAFDYAADRAHDAYGRAAIDRLARAVIGHAPGDAEDTANNEAEGASA